LAASLSQASIVISDGPATDSLAAVTSSAGDGFVVISAAGPKPFGASLIWALRSNLSRLTLMVDAGADPGVHARRAEALADPPSVLAVDGIDLEPVEPSSLMPTQPMPDGIEEGVRAMSDAGLDVVGIDGVAIGEYLGLEVARVCLVDGVCEVHVGIGAFDREANLVLHPGRSTDQSLRSTIQEVARQRQAGSLNHPLATIDRERWILKMLIDNPSLVGLSELQRLPVVRSRRGLKEALPAAAMSSTDDSRVMVVAGSGVDPAMLGDFADMIECHNPERVVFVPTTSLAPVVADVIHLMRVSTTVCELTPPWI